MTATDPTSLSAFYDELGRFDWDYDATDDPQVWTRCHGEHWNLRQCAKQSPEHQALFDLFNRHGRYWVLRRQYWPEGTPERPERPEEKVTI